MEDECDRNRETDDSNVTTDTIEMDTAVEQKPKSEPDIREFTLNYVDKITSAYNNAEDNAFAELLSLDNEQMQSELQDMNFLQFEEQQKVLKLKLEDPLRNMVLFHLKVRESLRNVDFQMAFRNQSALARGFVDVWEELTTGRWGHLTLEVLCRDLRRIAFKASSTDSATITSTHDNAAPPSSRSAMERAADVIMTFFRICSSESRTEEGTGVEIEGAKRWAMMMLANQLFKIYFKINRIQLCKPLIKAIDAQPKHKFAAVHLISYNYYAGKTAMNESDRAEAAKCLSYAFEKSPAYPDSDDRRKILMYLLPVKMALGCLPTERAMKMYALEEFRQIALAIRDGNIRAFDALLKANESTLYEHGIYFNMEQLRMLLYRNLFKKVYLLGNSNRIPLVNFEIALKWSGYQEVNIDEVTCILSNFIYSGKIRGYISHEHETLVVANSNPFPKLSGIDTD